MAIKEIRPIGDKDYGKCPYCDSEETINYDDYIYELGYSKRYCEDCERFYIVHFRIVATAISILG